MKSRRKNQTRSKSKSRRGPMRRHVLPKRHVSPKRHLSPKRHGATSGARLRSRTKTRGRSRKAMRGGMHTGQSSKNSSALPWIAGAVVGTSGLVLGAYMLNQLHQKQADTQASITELITNLNTLSLTSPELSTTDLSRVVTAVKELRSKLNTTQRDLETAQETQSLTAAQNNELQAQQEEITARANAALQEAKQVLEHARILGTTEEQDVFKRREAYEEATRQRDRDAEEKVARETEKIKQITRSRCYERQQVYDECYKILQARLNLINGDKSDDLNTIMAQIKSQDEYATTTTSDFTRSLENFQKAEQTLHETICSDDLTYKTFLRDATNIQTCFRNIPANVQSRIYKFLETNLQTLDIIDFNIVKKLLVAHAKEQSADLQNFHNQIIIAIDKLTSIFKPKGDAILHRILQTQLISFKTSLNAAYPHAHKRSTQIAAYNALVQTE